MEIVKANFDDLSQILELQKLCYNENAERYNDYQIPPLIQTLDDLESEYQTIVILKAIENNIIIGSIRAYEKNNTCYIGRVIVHPDYQNRGIGANLMSEIEKHFSDVSKFELFTGFKDEKNLNFYKKLGYQQFKEEKQPNEFIMIYLEKKTK